MRSKIQYKEINIIRVIACLAVLLYHFQVLKGGYLAVCVFFTLSGYLSCLSAFKKEDFSLKKYYLNRLQKLYLPLILVVFLSIAVVQLLPDLLWLNLKPETTSILFGYNNFWQLNANLDYFARHIDSPFIHLWYIAILFQFDLIFPFLFMILRKIGDKVNRNISCYLTIALSIISAGYFYVASMNSNIMFTYYHTLSRIFSLLFGVALAFWQHYYKTIIPKKNTNINKIIFTIYIFILIILFITIDAQSKYFVGAMIISSLITCRLISYAGETNSKLSLFDKTIKFLSNISYGIYLVQYPIIFLFQSIDLNLYLEILLMIILIILIAWLLQQILDFKSKKNIGINIFRILILIISLFGLYKYIIAKDYSDEMKELEEQLNQNQLVISEKQKEYDEKIKQEKEDWLATLDDLENGEEKLKNIVSELNVVGIGDSVMLGAVKKLYQTFPNGYFDAATSRTAWVAKDIIINLKKRNLLGDPIIFNLGANGDCSEKCKNQLIKEIGDRDIFWVNVTNKKQIHINERLNLLENKYENFHVIDWQALSKNHPEYFISDKIHLTESGKTALAKAIYDEIYQLYLERYEKEKQEIIIKYEEEQKKKKTFYGNSLLLNAFDYLENLKDEEFIIDAEFSFTTLKEKLKEAKTNNNLNHNVILVFDSKVNFTEEEYQELIEICKEHKMYIVAASEESLLTLENISLENIEIINFYQEIKNNNYLMFDKVHLTKEGNEALSQILLKTFEESNNESD